MYDIRIITASGEQSIDMLDASFPLNIESKSIGELDGNRASWSYTITLPRSERNEQVFSYLGAAYVSKAPARSVYECNVYTNGLRIIHNGLLYINKATETTYEVQIVCGVASLFERLRDFDFTNYNLAGQDFKVGNAYVYGDPTNFMYAGLELEAVDVDKTTSDYQEGTGITHPYQIPCIRLIGTGTANGILKHLLFNAINTHPYDLVTDALTMSTEDEGQTITRDLDLNLYATAVTKDAPNLSGTLYPHPILSVKNGLEFLQMIARILGTMVYVDEDADENGHRKVYMYTFNHLTTAASKAAAYDWTDKMAMDEDTQEYYDYGSYTRNNAVTQANNALLSFVDKHIFTIADERKTDDEYKAVDIPATSTNADEYFAHWENTEDGLKWKGVSAPYLVLNSHTAWQINNHNYRVSSEMIARQYDTLIRSLQDLLIVQGKFLLSATDVLNFRPYVPVFLRQYGAYFYVNKISNWEDCKLCEVELLRLK